MAEPASRTCCEGISYYLGFDDYFGRKNANLGDRLVEDSKRRIVDINQLFVRVSPNKLPEFYTLCADSCTKINGHIIETQAAKVQLEKNLTQLEQDTAELFCLARYVCQFAQWLLSLIFDKPGTAQLAQLDRNIQKMQGLRTNLLAGKFPDTTKSSFGICLNQNIKISRWDEASNRPTERNIRLYAAPVLDPDSSTVGNKFIFRLSEDGETLLGRLTIEQTSVKSTHNVDMDGRAIDEPALKAEFSENGDKLDRSKNGDRPVMSALMQLSVELLERHATHLDCESVYDQAHVLVAGGATHSNGRVTEKIYAKIFDVRLKENRSFPPFQDESGLTLRLTHRLYSSVFEKETRVRFDVPTTWDDIIKNNRMLPDGAILPPQTQGI